MWSWLGVGGGEGANHCSCSCFPLLTPSLPLLNLSEPIGFMKLKLGSGRFKVGGGTMKHCLIPELRLHSFILRICSWNTYPTYFCYAKDMPKCFLTLSGPAQRPSIFCIFSVLLLTHTECFMEVVVQLESCKSWVQPSQQYSPKE